MANANDYISEKLKGNVPVEKVDVVSNDTREAEYMKIFDDVQQYVVGNKLSELNDSIESNDHSVLEEVVRGYIDKHYRKVAANPSLMNDTVRKCLADMLGYGFLNKYFAQKDKIDEININAWNSTEIRWSDGRDEIVEDKFHSPQHAKDVIIRILRTTGKFLDDNRIYEVSYVGKSIRMAAAVYPLVDEDIGVAVSIRFIHSAIFKLDTLVGNGFLTADMANLLTTYVQRGVSVIVCGATGSGKTTLLNAVLEQVPPMMRMITLEGGTREFELIRYDENGRANNNRVHMQTRPHKDKNYNVDLQALLDLNLKFDPDIVVVGEMVSEEAFIASEMARTGHTVMTTIHTNNAFDAYYRMFTLGIRKYDLAENMMLKFMVDAFPIVVYCKKYADGQRRIQSILEGHFINNKIVYNELYRFNVEDNIYDENNNVTIVGDFRKLNRTTDELKERMIDNGARRSDLENI